MTNPRYKYLLLPDDRIYMSKCELATNTGNQEDKISDIEYENYLFWTAGEF
jgi:hypothetical protein